MRDEHAFAPGARIVMHGADYVVGAWYFFSGPPRERYYGLVDDDGAVSHLPAADVEQHAVPAHPEGSR